jgi:hypothetical protein
MQKQSIIDFEALLLVALKGHSMHVDKPSFSVYFPAEHSEQEVSLLAENCPGGQFLHSENEKGYLPGEQKSHWIAPVLETLPSGQDTHCFFVSDELKKPGEQGVQVVTKVVAEELNNPW